MRKAVVTKALFILSIVSIAVLIFDQALAQCPMCKAAAESSLKEGDTTALGLNTGILLLLSMPYLLAGIVGFLWLRAQRRRGESGIR